MKKNLIEGSIPKLLITIGFPASVGFMFNTLFNVVDTWYAGQTSALALTALSLSFPIYLIVIGLGSSIGTATNALLANAWGQNDEALVHRYFKNVLMLSTVSALVATILFMFISEPLLSISGASGETLALATQYVRTIFVGAIFFSLNYALNGFLASLGETQPYRNFLILGFFLNLLFNPWFVFGGFGVPALGVQGIALATVFVQLIGVVYLSYKVLKNPSFSLERMRQEKFSRNVVTELIQQAFPAFINITTISIGIFIIQSFVVFYGGDAAVAGYGTALRIEQIALLLTVGLNVATVSLAGQNFGAGHYKRVFDTMRSAMLMGALVMLVATVIVVPFAPQLMRFFIDDPAVIDNGVRYLRIEAWAFTTYIFINISVSILQAIKRPRFILYLGIYRQFVPIIFFYGLGTLLGWGLDGVWWGIVLINVTGAMLVVGYTVRMLRKITPTNALNDAPLVSEG